MVADLGDGGFVKFGLAQLLWIAFGNGLRVADGKQSQMAKCACVFGLECACAAFLLYQSGNDIGTNAFGLAQTVIGGGFQCGFA